MAPTDRNAGLRLLPTVVLLAAAVILYAATARYVLLHGHTWTDEVTYLVKSWWYTNGIVSPYTATDATWYMPFYFYQLGWWQQALGLGISSGRMLSIGLGAVNGLLLFLICRRLTGNTLAAAAGVFIFLATPATVFYFATATPAATVSMLHLGAIWLIVSGVGRPRIWATLGMGLLCFALFFYRQNMILGIVVLVPLYIAAIGRQRLLHSAILLATIAIGTAAVVIAFPDKLVGYIEQLPVLFGLLKSQGLVPPNLVLIDRGTMSPYTLGFSLDRIAPKDIYDAFLLPYSGTLILAVALFAVASGPLRILWIVPLYFLWMVVGHYLGSIGYCGRCVLSYTPYFVAVGAFAASLTLAMVARWARQTNKSPALLTMGLAIIAVALNVFAPGLAFDPDYRYFPLPQVTEARATTEQADIVTMARWVSSNTAPQEPILVIQGLGRQSVASLPYTVFLAGHMMPVQSLNLAQSKRDLNPKLNANAREAVQAAVEDESLWTDDTLRRWIERDYDTILFQEDKTVDQTALLALIGERFDRAAATGYRGFNIFLYKRKPAQ